MKGKLRTDAGIWIEQLLTAAPRAEVRRRPGRRRCASPPWTSLERNLSAAGRGSVSQTLWLDALRQPGLGRSSDPTRAVVRWMPPRPPPRTEEGRPERSRFAYHHLPRGEPYPVPPGSEQRDRLIPCSTSSRQSFLRSRNRTRSDGKAIGAEESPGTFTFGITVGLKRPLKL